MEHLGHLICYRAHFSVPETVKKAYVAIRQRINYKMEIVCDMLFDSVAYVTVCWCTCYVVREVTINTTFTLSKSALSVLYTDLLVKILVEMN